MIITIGSFDGFHRGHAALLDLCRTYSRFTDPDGWAVITFYPHPSEYIDGHAHSLFTLREREFIRNLLDIPNMYILSFNEALRNLTPRQFWTLLREKFSVDGLVMGADFHFGRDRAGSADYLARLAQHDGLSKIFILALIDKAAYSSSNVRRLIQDGKVSEAANVLNYPYFMLSRVLHGDARGRTMSYPTANIEIADGKIIPAEGVYSSAVLVEHEWHCGAVSIGRNPTFGGVDELRCEVNILDFSGDIYGTEVGVFFLERVRDIMTFHGRDELIAQIGRDTDKCRQIYEAALKAPNARDFLTKAANIYLTQDFTPEIIRLV